MILLNKSLICKVLEINRRSYYKWCEKGRPITNNFDSITAEIISKEHEANKEIYE